MALTVLSWARDFIDGLEPGVVATLESQEEAEHIALLVAVNTGHTTMIRED